METIRINGRTIQLDVADELSEYDFDNARWTSDKLIASSPFRDDMAPSFYVNISGDSAGTWGDSGTNERGGFAELIGLLRGTDREEAGDYLLAKYGELGVYNPDEPIRITSVKLAEGVRKHRILPDTIVTQATSPYLSKRGISADTQVQIGVGYGDTARGYTALPWHDSLGRIANVKYRSTAGRGFFYAKGATPISRLVYGINHAEDDCVIVEGEIDAMSWHEAGISAIAVGGAQFGRDKAEIVKRSKIKRLFLGGDNDEQGRLLNRMIAEGMRGYVEMYEIDYGAEKDANDVLLIEGAQHLRDIIANARPIRAMEIHV